MTTLKTTLTLLTILAASQGTRRQGYSSPFHKWNVDAYLCSHNGWTPERGRQEGHLFTCKNRKDNREVVCTAIRHKGSIAVSDLPSRAGDVKFQSVTGTRWHTHWGMPAYDVSGVLVNKGLKLHTTVRLILTREVLYIVICGSPAGDPLKDPDIDYMLKEIRFRKDPELPASMGLSRMILYAVVALVLLGGGVLGIVLFKKKKASGSGGGDEKVKRSRKGRAGQRAGKRSGAPAPPAEETSGDASPEAAPAETITISCPHCGKRLKAKAAVAGRKVKCPGCGEAFAAEAVDG